MTSGEGGRRRREAPGLAATIMAGACVGFMALGVLFTLGVVAMISMGWDNLAGVEWAAVTMLAISIGSTGLFAWWARTLWRGELPPEAPPSRAAVAG